jgi:hypothetical protein
MPTELGGVMPITATPFDARGQVAEASIETPPARGPVGLGAVCRSVKCVRPLPDRAERR